jgi:hypothetical protein
MQTEFHRPMKFHHHIIFHFKRMMRKDTLMFLIMLVPLVLLAAYLDMRLIGAMSFKNYVLTCVWEYALIMIAYAIGTWEGEKRPQFKWKD